MYLCILSKIFHCGIALSAVITTNLPKMKKKINLKSLIIRRMIKHIRRKLLNLLKNILIRILFSFLSLTYQ